MYKKLAGNQQRFYRDLIADKDLVSFRVSYKETDLFVRAKKNLSGKCSGLVLKYRKMIEKYIKSHPVFLTTFEPYPEDRAAPLIVKEMIKASAAANVGPMAAVAGAISEFIGMELLEYTPELIIENGGDIFLKASKERIIGIFAGEKSPFTERSGSGYQTKIGLKVQPNDTPMGICTSSGMIGHSFSYGNADAVVLVSKSATLADAAATAAGNIIKDKNDIDKGIEFVKNVKGIKGAVIIKNDKIGVWGSIELIRVG